MFEAMPRATGEGQTRSTPENHCSIMHLHCAKTKPKPEHCELSPKQILLCDMLEVVPGTRMAALGSALHGSVSLSHPSSYCVPPFPSDPCAEPSLWHRTAGVLPPSLGHQRSAPASSTLANAAKPGDKHTPCISQAFKVFTREGGFSSLSWEPNKKRVHCETFKGSRQDHAESNFNTGLSSSQ